MTIISENHRFLLALNNQPVDKTPVWLMRQAGRYLPEYKETRAKAGSFMQLCKNPELACEVTMQPLRRFDLDAAILFSDILTVPDAMGLGLYFIEGEGPHFKHPLITPADIRRLHVPDSEEQLSYVLQTIRAIKSELKGKLPLIGFSGSPWTLACYMLEGKPNKNFPKAMALLKESPLVLHELLNILAQSVIDYLNAQISAGVDVVMIFDTWGGLLKNYYPEFSLHYMDMILHGLHKNPRNEKVPTILFSKDTHEHLFKIAQTDCRAIGLDWNISLSEARKIVGKNIALQGNMDPKVLLQPPEKIRQEVRRILNDYGKNPGHIFNLGHGITPDVPPEHVAVMVDAVHAFSTS